MKRADLVRRIGQAARDAGASWTMLRSTGAHDVWACDGLRVSIPRHREINEMTAIAIMRTLAEKLGDDWWR
jgi:mRNA interferase HicA